MLSRCGALWGMSGTYHHTRTMLNRVYPHGKGRTDDDRRAGRIAIRVSRPPGFQVTVAIFSAGVVSVPLGAGNGGPRRLDSRRRGKSRGRRDDQWARRPDCPGDHQTVRSMASFPHAPPGQKAMRGPDRRTMTLMQFNPLRSGHGGPLRSGHGGLPLAMAALWPATGLLPAERPPSRFGLARTFIHWHSAWRPAIPSSETS